MGYKIKLKFKLFKSKIFRVGMFLFFIGVVSFIPSIFASLQPVRSVEILSSNPSYSKKEEGAWKITNSAEFISSDTVNVTMDLDTIARESSKNKDVVFLIDTSESMTDDKLDILKNGVIEAINKVLNNNSNKVGIISFNNNATIVSNLSNVKTDLINKINGLSTGNGTSYYQALINLDNILNNYENNDNRELKIIFITDGVPSKDSPNEVGEYKYLKDKYSFLNIDAVQYEAGEEIFESLEKISDKQYLVSSDSLEKKLISIATNASNLYKKFSIEDHLNDNFMVESINDIKVDTGSIELDNNIINWSLDNIISGRKAKMTFKAKLKNTDAGIYQLNNAIDVNYERMEGGSGSTYSAKTPVLSNSYKVIYDGNAPSGCSVSGVPSEESHKVFDTVGIAPAPKCSGYQFKGWKIVTENVKKINDDYFVMGESDVRLKGTWSKLDLKKSTDGAVEEGWTLYKQVKSDAGSSNRYAKKYTGDTSTFTGDKDVYYYYGAAANNNVVFANYCWKIVRTTDTGGVKLLYNGVPSSTGTCNNSGASSVLTASQMGTSSNKVAFNTQYRSPADVGYMYNTRYNTYTKQKSSLASSSSTGSLIFYDGYEDPSYDYADGFYFADSFEFRNGMYHLINPERLKYYDSRVYGKYYCPIYSSDQGASSCANLKYAAGGSSSAGIRYYKNITNGESIQKSYIAFSLDDSFEKLTDYFNDIYSSEGGSGINSINFVNLYLCLGEENCSNPKIITGIVKDSDSKLTFNYKDVGVKYGNSYTYSWVSGIHKLVNTVETGADSNHHFTCFNSSGECSTLSYIYYANSSNYYYIELTGGKNVNDALNDMLYIDNVNTNDSTIKRAIDYWYQNNMTQYTDYLEDTVWCNDRSIADKGGWDPSGGSLASSLKFSKFYDSNKLVCKNVKDRFTVSSSKGNGALIYPVGLLSRPEQYLSYADSKSPLSSNSVFHTISPDFFGDYGASNFLVNSSGNSTVYSVDGSYHLRPSISLRSGIEYSSGDGSINAPYRIIAN